MTVKKSYLSHAHAPSLPDCSSGRKPALTVILAPASDLSRLGSGERNLFCLRNEGRRAERAGASESILNSASGGVPSLLKPIEGYPRLLKPIFKKLFFPPRLKSEPVNSKFQSCSILFKAIQPYSRPPGGRVFSHPSFRSARLWPVAKNAKRTQFHACAVQNLCLICLPCRSLSEGRCPSLAQTGSLRKATEAPGQLLVACHLSHRGSSELGCIRPIANGKAKLMISRVTMRSP
jgi:hypothetical protein